MELDNFRTSWQQSAAAGKSASFDAAQLAAVLKSQPGLVEKMRRNARVEMALTALLMVVFPLLVIRLDKSATIVYCSLLVLMGVGQLYYYYYKLGVLRRMAVVEGDVRSHLRKLCRELRRLLRFFYRVTLGTPPVTLLLLFGLDLAEQLSRPESTRAKSPLVFVGFLLVFGVFMQVVAVYGTRWYLQRLYGRHLDRLEASLRELDETQ